MILWVLYDTKLIVVQYVPVPAMGLMYASLDMVQGNSACGLPVSNPTCPTRLNPCVQPVD